MIQNFIIERMQVRATSFIDVTSDMSRIASIIRCTYACVRCLTYFQIILLFMGNTNNKGHNMSS